MAQTKGTEPNVKHGGKSSDETPGSNPTRQSETGGENERDPRHSEGNFGGAGEHERKQPGQRQ